MGGLAKLVRDCRLKLPVVLFSMPLLTGCFPMSRYAPAARSDVECASLAEAYQGRCSSYYKKPDYEKGYFAVTGQRTIYLPPRHHPYLRDRTIIIIKERLHSRRK